MIILEKTIQPTKTSTNIVLGSICTFVSIEMISNLIITSDYWLCQLSVLNYRLYKGALFLICIGSTEAILQTPVIVCSAISPVWLSSL